MRTKLRCATYRCFRHRRWTGNRCGNSVVLDGSAMNQIINIDIENCRPRRNVAFRWRCWKTHCAKRLHHGAFSAVKAAGADGRPVATRSIGLFSTLYGAIEDMVLVWKRCWQMAPSHALKTCHVRGWPGHSSYHHRQRRCSVLFTEVTVKIFKFTPENNLFYGISWKI